MVAFYAHSEDQAGFRYDGTTWTRFGPPLTGDPATAGYSVNAAASVASAPLQVYAVESDSNVLSISSDGGASWIQRTITGLPTSPAPQIFSLWARAVGEVYLLQARGVAGIDGIWRTLDNGLTWTRIVPFALGLNPGGSHMAVGVNKLFYAVRTARAPDPETWEFRRCNVDGTGVETWATSTFTGPTGGILLRAISDDFVLAANFGYNLSGTSAAQGLVWRIDATGITDVRPSGLNKPWDALPLTATTWLAAGNVDTFPFRDVLVYRTTDAGATWTLATTIAAAQSFATHGTTDTYFMLSVPLISSPSDVVMVGNAAFNVQQNFWLSADAGATWTSVLNTADPQDESGEWLVFGPGGLASACPSAVIVSIPSRLATIVG